MQAKGEKKLSSLRERSALVPQEIETVITRSK